VKDGEDPIKLVVIAPTSFVGIFAEYVIAQVDGVGAKTVLIGTTIAVEPSLYSVAFVELTTTSGGSHASIIVTECDTT